MILSTRRYIVMMFAVMLITDRVSGADVCDCD